MTRKQVLTWYNGIFGIVTVKKKSKFANSALNISSVFTESMSEETGIILRPSLFKNCYKLHFMETLGNISRTLNVDRVVDYKDPIFKMCRSGDILGLEDAFRSKRASPDMVNPMGWGLLHVSSFLDYRPHWF